MALPDNVAEVITETNKALADTLANAFQSLRFQRTPTVKLRRFLGAPRKVGDPSLHEWVIEVESYGRQLNLPDTEILNLALDHLGGEAKEEVQFSPAPERKDFDSVCALLARRFGRSESVQSLNSAFYGRCQESGETLAEFSRALMSLYGRLELAAEGTKDKGALVQLKENALKEQLVKGVRDTSVKRELRRLSMADTTLTFYELREQALKIFSDGDEGMAADVLVIEKMTDGRQGPTQSDQLSQLLEGQKEIQKALTALVEQQAHLSRKLGEVASSLQSTGGHAPSRNPGEPRRSIPECSYCHKKGHVEDRCFKKLKANAKDAPNSDKPSGNAAPPS
jgi:hypothetical protein